MWKVVYAVEDALDKLGVGQKVLVTASCFGLGALAGWCVTKIIIWFSG
jgi:hypothetical protein